MRRVRFRNARAFQSFNCDSYVSELILERSECLTIQTDHVRVGAAKSLSMQTARTLAKRITLACRSTIPSELFTAQERADMEGADRFDIIRELMSKPPSDVR